MKAFIRREFIVDKPVDVVWAYFAQIEQWHTWAKHITSITHTPSGELSADSQGALHLKIGVKSTFKMVEFNKPHNWMWVGPFMGLTVYYDHQFEALDDEQTKMTWIVKGEGFASSIIGRLFAVVYTRNLNVAVPNLIAEINAL